MTDLAPLTIIPIDKLRELTIYRDRWYALARAIRDEVEMPEPWLLVALGSAAKFPDDCEMGKELQRQRRYDIPYKTEAELGAGLWQRIRRGLRPEPQTDATAPLTDG